MSLACGRGPPPELCLDESFEVAVQNTLWISELHVRPVVLHHLVRRENVGADLTSEVHSLSLATQLVHLLLALPPLQLS